jgi:signal transduction histidine kinase
MAWRPALIDFRSSFVSSVRVGLLAVERRCKTAIPEHEGQKLARATAVRSTVTHPAHRRTNKAKTPIVKFQAFLDGVSASRDLQVISAALSDHIARELARRRARVFLPTEDASGFVCPAMGPNAPIIPVASPLLYRLSGAGGYLAPSAIAGIAGALSAAERAAIAGLDRPELYRLEDGGATVGLVALSTTSGNRRGQPTARARQVAAGIAQALRRALPRPTPPDAGVANQHAGFLAEVAHQLLTPVTSLRAGAEMLHEQDAAARYNLDPATVRRITLSLERGVRVLETQINRLLQYGQLRTGQARFAPSNADLERVVRDCVTTLDATFISRAQRLRVEIPRPLPLLVMDVEQIQQALLNLLSNASKFSPAGNEILVRLMLEDGRVRVGIEDACGGLTADELGILARPYALRSRPPAFSQSGGIGIGIAIARGIVELHGGTLSLENLPGRGCRFTIEQPLRPGNGGDPG